MSLEPTPEQTRLRADELRRNYADYKGEPREADGSNLPPKMLALLKETEEKTGFSMAGAMAKEPEPEPIVQCDLHIQGIGKATFSSENYGQWRNATTEDAGGTIVFCGYQFREGDFGEFDDLDEEPDEEFPDEYHTVAIVYTQSGKMFKHMSNGNGVFEDIKVVPESVMKGIRNEAPPGKYFSGFSVRSREWTPAPEGKVWFEHPFYNSGTGVYLTYLEHFIVKRCCELGLSLLMYDFMTSRSLSRDEYFDREFKIWRERASLEFWCPIKKKFMSEGEMLQQEAWFHNGDGSAQQRRYYTQYEMLDKYGGEIGVVDEDSVVITAVKTSEDRARESYVKALRNGEVIDLEGIGKPSAAKRAKR